MKPFRALSSRCCRWPVGPDPGRGFIHLQMWCGEPCSDGAPYCEPHIRRAWLKRRAKSENSSDFRARNLALIKLAVARRQEKPVAETDTLPDAPANDEPSSEQGDTMRAVVGIDIGDLTPGEAPTPAPQLEWMSPSDLLVEGRYQRDLSDASMRQIRRIIAAWDWRKFKPPIVAWTERGFEIIDGQHTAIAAASHPAIDRIPVLVVEAPKVEDRAAAFIGHNRDRVAVTPTQIHHAAVAAGDPEALTVQQVVDRAGAAIVVSKWGGKKWKAGETVAVSAIGSLIDARGAMKARMVLQVLVEAEVAPIGTTQIRAADMLMHDPEFAEIDLEHLPATITALDGQADRDAKLDAQTHGIPIWQALGRVWFRKCRKKRRAA